MEELAISIIRDGGMVAVLFVLLLLAFGWCYLKIRDLEHRLDEGNARFDKMDSELKEINKSLNIIIGKVDTMLRRSGHTPEDV